MVQGNDHQAGSPLASEEKLRVWDLPTRFFHWALVGVVGVGLYLGEYRSFSTIDLHFYFGYAAGGLLVFRMLVGIWGAPASRLGALTPSAGSVFRYALTLGTRQPSDVSGHNPLGAVSALLMLMTLTVQVVTGLFAEDDTMFAEGPFADTINGRWVITITALHHWCSRVFLGLISIHVLAVLFYLVWKRENLILPMISGSKRVKLSPESPANKARRPCSEDRL